MSEASFGDLQIVEKDDRPVMTWRQFRARKGESHAGHKHTIDHFTLLIKGEIELRYDDGHTENYVSPASISVAADVEHTLTALVDDSIWLCTFLIPEGGDAATLSMER